MTKGADALAPSLGWGEALKTPSSPHLVRTRSPAVDRQTGDPWPEGRAPPQTQRRQLHGPDSSSRPQARPRQPDLSPSQKSLGVKSRKCPLEATVLGSTRGSPVGQTLPRVRRAQGQGPNCLASAWRQGVTFPPWVSDASPRQRQAQPRSPTGSQMPFF